MLFTTAGKLKKIATMSLLFGATALSMTVVQAEEYQYAEFDNAQFEALYAQAYEEAADEAYMELQAHIQTLNDYYLQAIEDGDVSDEEVAELRNYLDELEALDDDIQDQRLAEFINRYEAMLAAGIEHGFIQVAPIDQFQSPEYETTDDAW